MGMLVNLTVVMSVSFGQSTEMGIGARLFVETGFSAHSASAFMSPGSHNRALVRTTSCQSCHFNSGLSFSAAKHAFRGARDVNPIAIRFTLRSDSHALVSRNSPVVVDGLETGSTYRLLHFDGEFASPESLVKESFLGRNFGWLPEERMEAIRHFARVIRDDRGGSEVDFREGRLPYTVLLRGTDPATPDDSRLPKEFRCDPDTATDEEILDACSRLVVEFMRTLQFSRDASGQHDGSPYDAFLVANRLPRTPSPGQTPEEYGRRLGEQVATLRVPRFVDDPGRSLRDHGDQPFRFGELELQGMRIFFRGALGGEKGGAGNCAECHIPPRFSDFKFHNTGAAQDEYDAIQGEGAFARLRVPDLATRDTDFDRWLPANWRHPRALGPFRSIPEKACPELTDLGVWNVYANPDLPAPQAALEHLLNPSRALTRSDVLDRAFARFKTSGLRDLGRSAPYLHTGQMRTLEDVIVFYQRMGDLAQAGRLRHAPPEYFAMRLGPDDVAPLTAFLRALNE